MSGATDLRSGGQVQAITGGEFGAFMRKGEVLPPRETLVERRAAITHITRITSDSDSFC